MYSWEQKIKAVDLWLKYDKCETDVIKEPGYSSQKMLTKWHDELQQEKETGIVRDRFDRYSTYTRQQKQAAVEHYLEHGKRLSRTVRALGYPSKQALSQWCEELAPEQRKSRSGVVQFSQEQKMDAVIALCSRRDSAQAVAEASGTTRTALYKWKKELLGKENGMARSEKRKPDLPDDKDLLLSEIDSLKEQVRRLKLEKDILEATAELIKKDPGVDPESLSNREKTMLIDALKGNHPQKDLLKGLGIARSSYYYQHWAVSCEGKYEKLKAHIVELFVENESCYGYRRMHLLFSQEGTKVSEKGVRTLMAETT